MTKSSFLAKFTKSEYGSFRYDTRIYLEPTHNPSDNDYCIGAIVGKNPGSAKSSGINLNGYDVIDLDGDKLLPTVRNIFLKYRQNIKSGEYIQVLNLFYLCDKNLDDAIKEYDSISSDDLICTTEKKLFPFIWYVWGGNNLKLNKYKERFSDISTNKHFFFSKNNNDYKMIDTIPKHNELAKHTQGFPYNNITIGEQFKNLFI